MSSAWEVSPFARFFEMPDNGLADFSFVKAQHRHGNIGNKNDVLTGFSAIA
jgi:hypothetical protein